VRSITRLPQEQGGTFLVRNHNNTVVKVKQFVTNIPWAEANAGWLVKQTKTLPIKGDVGIELTDGKSVVSVDPEDIDVVHVELQHNDVRVSVLARMFVEYDGMLGTDSDLGEVKSQAMRWINRLDREVHTDETRPDWAPSDKLRGIKGDLRRAPGDKIIWVRGANAAKRNWEITAIEFAGWYQVGADGRVLNEGFTKGEPDRVFALRPKLDWYADNKYNPFWLPQVIIDIMVNGNMIERDVGNGKFVVTDEIDMKYLKQLGETKGTAKNDRGQGIGLPQGGENQPHWRKHIIPIDEIEANPPPQGARPEPRLIR